MRLLEFRENKLSLAEFVGDNTPPYAILSHTWGADNEEVTLKDLVDGVGKAKIGYKKIQFCGKQCGKDNLQYFWVDTCCIDKSSSAELSEAINSMFRWYQNAARCYVYLTDVSTIGLIGSDPVSRRIRNQALQRSRWFTRGWTLQELVAPMSVEFFSVEGRRIGDKSSMVQEIHEISGISVRALQGIPPSQFSVDERMSWAAKRETTRHEDAAYSLLGIFDIHMPLIYGEGRMKAMKRLQNEIQASLENESSALPPKRPRKQPMRENEDDREIQRGRRNVCCFKCDELGHYANEPHCDDCGDEYGHIADDPHCYTCGEYGHYANELHCYECKTRGHFARNCPYVDFKTLY